MEGITISIRAARINADLTQKQTAQLLGVTPATVSNWETGVTRVRLAALRALSEVYGCPVEMFTEYQEVRG